MQNKEIPVLILSGPVGVGKSSVTIEIAKILSDKNISHGLIDVDYLRYVYPPPADDPFYLRLGYKNLAAVAENYRNVGVKRLIISNVIEEQKNLDDIRKAIPGAKLIVVRLRGKLKTIQDRLRKRESGKSLSGYLNRAKELSEQLEKAKVEDMVVNIDEKSLHEVAEEVIEKSKFILDSGSSPE